MGTVDMSEKGLESLIVRALTGAAQADGVREPRAEYAADGTEGAYVEGVASDYVRELALDVPKLLAFLQASQPQAVERLGLLKSERARTEFLQRVQGEVEKRGTVDVLRHGVGHKSEHVRLYKVLPTPGNAAAAAAFAHNLFSVTRQLRYSMDETQRALDMVIFINGLPLLTFELKNSLTGQTVHDAVRQYQTTRNPRELLFHHGRCVAHFAVDDAEVRFCAQLRGVDSQFLPFNKGCNGGAGNPPNPHGLKTEYLWREVLPKAELAAIVENYAHVVQGKDAAGKKLRRQMFPRFHQWRTVRALLRRVRAEGAGRRYLIQHSAGSGKSNTIAWLAYQLAELRAADGVSPLFDSVLIITDRRALDAQLSATIRSYQDVQGYFVHSDRAQDLRQYLQAGRRMISTTVQKFPFVCDELHGMEGKRFALLIDEAHSGQGGKTAAAMHAALQGEDEYIESIEDAINARLLKMIEARRMPPNASFFAFTATPKNKTLELFGERSGEGGEAHFRAPPELTYSMRQAIEEGFILDVLANYTPVESFFHIAPAVADDPEFDRERALKKIHRYVQGHQAAIRQKAEIMVDHFAEKVARKIGGQARAMIVCSGIRQAIDYWREVSAYLKETNSRFRALVAFSGDFEVAGEMKTESDLNGFPGREIPQRFKEEPYRFLIVADKFVTGFDEPLLHTMYVDKKLAGVQAVQTLSRLNRAHPGKTGTFVLDFAGNAEAVLAAFQTYYQTTLQKGETDPNKLHDLKRELDAAQVYTQAQVQEFVALLFGNVAGREPLDAILDACVAVYCSDLDEDGQVEFKSKAKAFVRAYGFLSAILPYGSVEWERLDHFLRCLLPKLPAPKEDDLSQGVLQAIDMDSYRAEVKQEREMALAAEDAELEPLGTGGGGGKPDPDNARLSEIVKEFNEQFGNIEWSDEDKIRKLITEEFPVRVAQEQAFQNAILGGAGAANARLRSNHVLQDLVTGLFTDHTQLYAEFTGNDSFKEWMRSSVFELASRLVAAQQQGALRV